METEARDAQGGTNRAAVHLVFPQGSRAWWWLGAPRRGHRGNDPRVSPWAATTQSFAKQVIKPSYNYGNRRYEVLRYTTRSGWKGSPKPARLTHLFLIDKKGMGGETKAKARGLNAGLGGPTAGTKVERRLRGLFFLGIYNAWTAAVGGTRKHSSSGSRYNYEHHRE